MFVGVTALRRFGAENRLAADHDELILAGHVRGRGDDVLELLGPHLADLVHDAPALRLA